MFLTSWDVVRTNQVIVWHIQKEKLQNKPVISTVPVQLSACSDLKAADQIIIKFGFGGFQ